MGCAPACKDWDFNGGLIYQLATAIASPLDLLFGGFDGVYGCFGGFGGKGGACGPCLGPLPCALAAVPLFIGAPSTMFETLW
jgi:hypothetical protein